MTVLFYNALNAVTRHFGVPFEGDADRRLQSRARGVYLSPESRIDVPPDLDCRGSHIVRDPRDILVSSYFYHLRTTESWCAEPSPANTDLPANVSYQQHLRSLPLTAGLRYELDRVTGRTLMLMEAWSYDDERVLELKFEEMLDKEHTSFAQILEWYGLDPRNAAKGAAIAASYARRNAGGRRDPRSRALTAHMSGHRSIGIWESYFDDNLRRSFKQRFQPLLERLGYVKDPFW